LAQSKNVSAAKYHAGVIHAIEINENDYFVDKREKNPQKSKYHHLNTEFYLHSQGEEHSGRELSS